MFSLLLALQITAVANPGTRPVNPPVGLSATGRDRLASQFVRGTQRICVYGSGQNPRALAVGRGEPCPVRYHPAVEEAPAVPSMAILASEAREEGRLVCIYRYAGVEYRVGVPLYSMCALTPSGLTPLEVGEAEPGQ